MEFNKKNNAGKLSPPPDNSEYQEEVKNEFDDEDDVSFEQNFTDVRKGLEINQTTRVERFSRILDSTTTYAEHM